MKTQFTSNKNVLFFFCKKYPDNDWYSGIKIAAENHKALTTKYYLTKKSAFT